MPSQTSTLYTLPASIWLEAIASSLEAIAGRLEAIAIRFLKVFFPLQGTTRRHLAELLAGNPGKCTLGVVGDEVLWKFHRALPKPEQAEMDLTGCFFGEVRCLE